MSGVAPFGAVPYGVLSGEENVTGTPYVNLQWNISSGSPYAVFHFTGYNIGTPYSNLQWNLNTGSPYANLQWQTIGTGTPYLDLEWTVQDNTGFPATAENWSVSLTIDGTDYSSRLTGQVKIDSEEDSSTIAEFSLLPSTGAIDQMSWVGKTVIINITSGSNTSRRFKGLVSNAIYDANAENRQLKFVCTNDLQGYFENSDRDTIDGIINGYWSEYVFNDDGDGWTYTQDQLSTIYSSIYLNSNGHPVVTSLQSKLTPDFTFTDSERFNGTLNLTRATRRDLINRIRMNLDYRFTRLRQRHLEYQLQWRTANDSLSWCDFLIYTYTLLSREDVEASIDATGWQLLGSVQYKPLPDPGVYNCSEYFTSETPQSGQNIVWSQNTTYLNDYCLEARWTMAKRFSQTVEEKYIFDIRADNSIEYTGEVGIQQRFAINNPDKNTSWESDAFTAVASGATQESTGDYIIDELDGDQTRTQYNNAYQTALAQATVSIKKSHRVNTVSFEIPYHSELNLTHTVKVDSGYLTAQGKVRQLVETFDIDSGESTSQVSIALSLHGGTGVVTDTSIAAEPVTETALTDYEDSFIMHYYIGGEAASQPYDEDWDGFITNRTYPTGNYTIYEDDGFKIRTPDISSEYRDTLTITENKQINVNIVEDLLTLSA